MTGNWYRIAVLAVAVYLPIIGCGGGGGGGGRVDSAPPSTTADPAGGSYADPQSVTLSADETSTIYYTTDGTTPTRSSTQYSSAIQITAEGTTTLKYYAVDTAGNEETVKSEAYHLSFYVWPLSASETPDEMTTSFGPRINWGMWDFHDGIDFGGIVGTPVYAVRAGTVYKAADGGGGSGYSSRHIVLEVDDPNDGTMYIVYLHLDSILAGITPGATVTGGQAIGTLGDDDAAWAHLHFEFRKNTPLETGSVHPMNYLPYTDTTNFTAPVIDRFNRIGGLMAARLLFDAASRLEGDLRRVEVDLLEGTSTIIATRVVDFDDKTTINEGNGDDLLYTNNIGVEGYQSSDMISDGRDDLEYGILVNDLPANCDNLQARVIDAGGNTVTSSLIAVPNQTATSWTVDLEDAWMPPAGWTAVTSTGTAVSNDPSAKKNGSRGMLCVDGSTSSSGQRAGIERALPSDRFEWTAQGWFNPVALGLASGRSVYPFYCLNGSNLSVAARVRNTSGTVYAGIIAKKPDGSLTGVESAEVVATGTWVLWKIFIQRIGTRETTAVLYLDDVEADRLTWDSTVYEPTSLRAGIGYSSSGVTATFYADDLQVNE